MGLWKANRRAGARGARVRRKGAENGCNSGFRALAHWGAGQAREAWMERAVCATGRFTLAHAQETGLLIPSGAAALPYRARAVLAPCFRGVSEWLQIVDESDSKDRLCLRGAVPRYVR